MQPETSISERPNDWIIAARRSYFVLFSFVACFTAVCALFHDCIGVSVSIFGRDTVSHDYGMLIWAWSEIETGGKLPLWNPYLFGGIPTLGTFAFCPFNLQSIPFLFLPFPLAFTLQYLLAFAIGGTGMALLLRKLGCGALAAIVIGVVFSLSGHFTTLAHAGHLSKAIAFSWVPWAFWLGERWFEKPTWPRALMVSIPLALMILASHLQIVYLAGFFLCVWLVMKVVLDKEKRQTRALAQTAMQIMCAILFSGILGAAQLLPGLEMAPISNRAAGVTHEEAARTSYPPEELLEYVIPGWCGANYPNSQNPYRGRWGEPMAERIISDYFGVGALVLAFAALIFVSNRNKFIWTVIAIFGIWIGVGVYGGLWQVLRHIPGFASFRSPAVAMGWTTIGTLVLAGIGLDAITRHVKLKTTAPYLVLLIGCLLIFDVGLRSRKYVAPLNHNDFMAYLQNATPTTVRNDDRKPVRVFQKGQELTNAFMAARVGSVHGYHPITFKWYDDLIRRIGFYDPRVPELFHQNWYLWPPNEEPPDKWTFRELTARGQLLERGNPTPYVIFPERLITASNQQQALDSIADPAFDPMTLAVVEKMSIQPASGRMEEVTAYLPNEVWVNIDVKRTGAVVFADLTAPGWFAYQSDSGFLNGPLESFMANTGFRGAILPAGHYALIWRYEPFSFRLGLFLSLAGLCLLIALTAIMRTRPGPGPRVSGPGI